MERGQDWCPAWLDITLGALPYPAPPLQVTALQQGCEF